MGNRNAVYLPTPDKIIEECAKLQASWSPQEEAKHRRILAYDYNSGCHVWRVPMIALADTILGPRRRGKTLTRR